MPQSPRGTGVPFVDSYPPHMDILRDQVSLLDSKAIDRIELTADQASDPSIREAHNIIFRKPFGVLIYCGAGSAAEWCHNLAGQLQELHEAKKQVESFITMLGPFLKDTAGGGDEVLTLEVLGQPVSACRATLERLGPNNALLKRFTE